MVLVVIYQQLTLKDIALDGETLWICGRVNCFGGIAVSNTEFIKIEYISPDLVSGEYFNMAIHVKKDGFYDGSRNIINAYLFPIYANLSHLNSTPFIFI